ncbi:FtsX-like permease family protein [Posidoniimonas polymericola]|uniref:FtsX-like permease family protein n=1 Tax=Posidoniimonas polymericola TaxID=2528002 RepID=A0A5C5ZF23_9BACT|nr:FtsX-like permease family protein [Posidoniimonas polymericola]TWT85441.1 FtsX-like permease family protein [Posidoniimonas polymericola]
MISALDRKLIRDLAGMWGQALMIALVVSAGVATFINSRTMLYSLETTRASFYDRYYFADVFAAVKRAPEAIRQRAAAIPGVARVETRVVEMVNLDVPGMDEPAVGQLISMPVSGEPSLNRVYLRRGRRLEPNRDDEILASEKFTEANGLTVGDSVTAIINGRKKELRIVGVVLSPEYVFQVKPGDIVPDPEHFGVFWMNREALEMAFDMEGAFNDLSIGLMRGAQAREVIFRLDQLLEPYGGLGAYGREDQLSHMLLESDIQGLKTTGLVAPSIFLAVAAFLLNVVLARLLALQREQIAALKAFGYSNVAIGWHYLKFVMAIIAVGSVIGIFGGWFLGHTFTVMIAELYQYPELVIRVRPSVIATAVSVAAGAALIGAVGAVSRAVRVPPAEAMRPEPPASFGPTLLERLGLGRLLPSSARMVLRQIERRPLKSALSIVAIALSVAIIVVGQFIQDSMDYTLDHQFFRVQRYDITVNTLEAGSTDILHDLRHVPGVIRAEPVRMVAARLRHGPRSRRVALMGLPQGGTLYRMADSSGAMYQPPPGGVTLSASLARRLGIEVGQTVRIETLEGKRPTADLPVVSLMEDLQGLNAYMDLRALNALMRQGPRVTGAYLLTDPALEQQTYATLKDTPKLTGVTLKSSAIESFQDTLAKNLGTMKKINLFFACVIAVGVVYNSARIAQSERSRELATLRVVGFTRGEISAILLGELGLLTLLAMPLGWMMGYGFATALNLMMNQMEAFRFPLVVERSTYGIASGVVLTAATLSGLLVRRSLDHLDLIAVLKARD